MLQKLVIIIYGVMQYIPIILLLLFASCNANTKKTEDEIVKTRITKN